MPIQTVNPFDPEQCLTCLIWLKRIQLSRKPNRTEHPEQSLAAKHPQTFITYKMNQKHFQYNLNSMCLALSFCSSNGPFSKPVLNQPPTMSKSKRHWCFTHRLCSQMPSVSTNTKLKKHICTEMTSIKPSPSQFTHK